MKKIRAIPKGVKASMAFLFANVISSGIAYITTPIYTRLLSAEEYGQTAAFLTWLQIFGIIAMFSLSSGVFNNGMLDHSDDRDNYSFSMLILSNIITVIFFVIICVCYPFLKDVIGVDLPLIFLMFALFLVNPAYNFWTSRQRYELKYKYVVLWTIVCAILSPLISIVCILMFQNNKLYGRLFGAEGALIAVYIGFYIYLIYKNKGKVNRSYWKEAIVFNLPLIPHYLSTYLLGGMDKLMISNIIGDAATAYYSVAHSVAFVITIVWSAMNSSLVPYTYEKLNKKDHKSLANVSGPLLLIFAFACFMLIMLAPELIGIMATKEYLEAVYVIPPLVGGVYFQACYHIFANVLYYKKAPKYVMFSSVTSMVANFILNYYFINKFGYMAAGYTTLVCYALQAVIDYIAMRKVMRSSIYNMKLILPLSVLMIVVSLFTGLIYDIAIFRYIIVIVIFAMLVVFRKKIIDLFSRIKGESK